MVSKAEMQAAKQALRKRMRWQWGGKHTRHWHGLPPGILGIGFGVKRTAGKVVDKKSLRIYVNRKLSRDELDKKQRIPRRINGYLTDVIPVGKFKPHFAPGDAIGNSGILSGTLACLVEDDQAAYLLGSWHVLTNTTGKDGDPVFMPPSAMAGAAVVGRLIATPTMNLNGGENAFDAAVAEIQGGVDVDPQFAPGQSFGACATATAGAKVRKRGAATDETTGTVDGVSEDIPIMYNGRVSDRAMLTGQITVLGDNGRFSDEGDSGALLCTTSLRPLGIVVGGTTLRGQMHTLASPIGPILDFYKLQLKTS